MSRYQQMTLPMLRVMSTMSVTDVSMRGMGGVEMEKKGYDSIKRIRVKIT